MEAAHRVPQISVTAHDGKAGNQRLVVDFTHELAPTREYLQSVQVQHEAVSGELSSASEELQSSNEELQSINEELESAKEELQSVNQELATINDELERCNQELTRTNSDLVNLTDNTCRLTVMMDRNLNIRRFSPRVRTQQKKDKHKLHALHVPEAECIGKGKARKPYEFGVKASIAVTHKSGLMVGVRTFSGNPYDGHILSAQLEQTRILLEDAGRAPKEVVVDLGLRGVDGDNPSVEIIHRGKYTRLSRPQQRWLKRRQAVGPAIGHLKADHRMDRCWLKGQLADALQTVLCAGGYNLRWLMGAMMRLGSKDFFFAWVVAGLGCASGPPSIRDGRFYAALMLCGALNLNFAGATWYACRLRDSETRNLDAPVRYIGSECDLIDFATCFASDPEP